MMDWYDQPRELLFSEYLLLRDWNDTEYATNPDFEDSHVSGILQAALEEREPVDVHIFEQEWTSEPIEIFEVFVLRMLHTLSKPDHFEILETLVAVPGGYYGHQSLRAVARYYQLHTMDKFFELGGPRNLMRVFCDAFAWAKPALDIISSTEA
ncbi:uncharacterized protein Triagg1_1379 [Trichoderma aggressivum f. europaeum]|uniref:Uncharacterized protein n=1 Tax=Trichoderma aggressivum f. europaeum TaxID=173218 RepID=A0AAE1IJK6_9HYPO|nr:hypothetical protein Triagg1_1379 [Trichoderma aggressivum f. europaeum]